MRNARIVLLTLVALLLVAALIIPATAQDDMTHTCDSTTILLLFLAEHEYGYAPMMDMSTFDLGQYQPLFDMQMAMVEAGDAEMMSEEDMADMMATQEAMMAEMQPMEGMTMLAPATIADEDPACTELRASVENFIYSHFSMEMMAMEEGSS
jgi:hypothetical protein